MQPIRFIMMGGFLGAGKTTTIARLAGEYQRRQHRVAVITNDHASELVDSHTLQSLGFHVGEIAGACFCGNLDDLMSAVDRVGAAIRPDTLFVEPVGSCTDLVASVIRPLQRSFANEFEVAPYCVLLKPSHGLKILSGAPAGGFSPKAEYIFRKQLEEADLVAINRIDQLLPEQIAELESRLSEQYPGIPVLQISAKHGDGFAALMEFLDQRGNFGKRLLSVDYETYAAGEAELGWLNGSFLVHGRDPFDLDDFLLRLTDQLRRRFIEAGIEPAHLKVMGLWEGSCGVANWVASTLPAELSQAAHRQVPKLHLIINARLAADPTQLADLVGKSLTAIAVEWGLNFSDKQIQSFRPGESIQPIGLPLRAKSHEKVLE